MDRTFTWRAQLALLAVVTLAGIAGFFAPWAWVLGTAIGLAYSVAMVARDIAAKRFGADVLAILSLAGTLMGANTSWARSSR